MPEHIGFAVADDVVLLTGMMVEWHIYKYEHLPGINLSFQCGAAARHFERRSGSRDASAGRHE
jgi:hypothetical protein